MPALTTTSDGFLLHGEPFRIISGALHYFRVHPDQWADRLRKARLMGLNTVETYVPWNLHQPEPGTLVLDGLLDLPRFLRLAQEEGLHVLLRPGPFICAEWDGGGLPAWLTADPDIRLRTSDPRFTGAVDRYLDLLLPAAAAVHGGGTAARSSPCRWRTSTGPTATTPPTSSTSQTALRAPRRRGAAVHLRPGRRRAPGGRQPARRARHRHLRQPGRASPWPRCARHQPEGPLMCAEFWIGWFDHWGGPHHVRDAADAAADLDRLLVGGRLRQHLHVPRRHQLRLHQRRQPQPRLRAHRHLLRLRRPAHRERRPRPEVPRLPRGHRPPRAGPRRAGSRPRRPNSRRTAVELTDRAPLLAATPAARRATRTETPVTMDELGQRTGYVLYRTTASRRGRRPAALRRRGRRPRPGLRGRRPRRRTGARAPRRDAARARPARRRRARGPRGEHGRRQLRPAHRRAQGPARPGHLQRHAPCTAGTATPLPLDDLAALPFAPTERDHGRRARPSTAARSRSTPPPTPSSPCPAGPRARPGSTASTSAATGTAARSAPCTSRRRCCARAPTSCVLLELHATTGTRAQLTDTPDLGPEND